ncbi:hypothetical protein RB195_016314 [Necator americanus]|uniref:Uncharacterized protein n=1 Tax=Necator americanus TaxID=51031 RepID=A0ABR1EAG9_NECAM
MIFSRFLGYAPYHFAPHYPYVGAIAAPAPIMHSAVPAYSSVVPYPVVSPAYPHHRELHNVAGAIQREKELLTDVSLRFPAKKERLAKHKNLEKN